MDQVASFSRPVRFGELLEQSPFPKATLYRFLQSLSSQGMLAYDRESQTYSLGMRLVRLAHAAWSNASLAPVARPHLDRLSEEIGETVHLAQLDAAQVLYVDKRNALRPVEMFAQAGKVGPAYCTGIGKAMLAYLDEESLDQALAMQSFHRFTDNTLTDVADLRRELAAIRARGHAYDREEHEPGIICVAAPILDGGGQVLGGVSVTGPTSRTSYDMLDSWAPQVRETAVRIGIEAQAWRFPNTGLGKVQIS